IKFEDDLFVRLLLRRIAGPCGRGAQHRRHGRRQDDLPHDTLPFFLCRRHMCDGSHKAMMGNAIRITSRIRSVRMKGMTPLKMVAKLTSLMTLFITNTFMPTGG